ncbi:Ig-like domain-containing protein [Peribacillus simplex]|uniref:Ig-like domain-containing protein n=1 Tax=Peribacillus simplex TaxID=1478 RepID=A0AAW7IBC5_9BACI|nr:Ig-like domain-containing protein [Peribacillus simplex]MDM5292829.1 Ig-like domain-containing protein [Peribacillus simplex]MDM5451754.1 Ig-like domain-containing protein [Peribacillus simplex]
MKFKNVSRFTAFVLIFALIFSLMVPLNSQAATATPIENVKTIKNGDNLDGKFEKPDVQWYQITPTKEDIQKFSHAEFEVNSDKVLNISVYQDKEKAEKDESNYLVSSYPDEKAVVDFPYAWGGTYYVKVEYFGDTDDEGNPIPDAKNEAEYSINAHSVTLPPSSGDEEMESCSVELSVKDKKTGESMLKTLRVFRDEVLTKSSEGRSLSSLYYKASPFLAIHLAGNKTAREAVYNHLVVIKPLIEDLNENGASSTAVISNKQQEAIKALFNKTADVAPAGLKKEMNSIAKKINLDKLAGERIVDIASKAGIELPASKNIKNKYIVKLKPGKSLSSVQSKVKGKGYGTLSAAPKQQEVLYDDMYVVELNNQAKMSTAALSNIEKLPEVEYIEAVKTYKALSADIQSPYQWSLNNAGGEDGIKGADIDNEKLQNLIKKRNLKDTLVAVVDTGVDDSLADLKDTVRMDLGKNFIDKKENAVDDNGHGTHVSGIIAAKADNGYSMQGINPVAKIMPVKVLDSSGSGDMEKVALGIKYAVDHGAKVINLSLGGEYSRTIEYALKHAAAKNVMVVVASGNDGMEGLSYPASSKYAISVGATNALDLVSDYSNYGSKLDMVAPGTGIPSLVPNGNVTYMDGTSMATPHVAAATALLLSGNPGLKVNEVREILHETSEYVAFEEEDNVDPYEGYEPEDGEIIIPEEELPVGKDLVSGFGRLNAYSALSAVELQAKVNLVMDTQTKLTGSAKKGSVIEVKNGKKTLGKATAAANGTFTVTIPVQKAEQQLTVNISDSSKLAVSSIKVFVNKGATPNKPTVKALSDKDTYVTGQSQADMKITIKNSAKKVIGSGNTDSKGNFKVKISKQKAGTKLSVTATDLAKRESKAATVTVLDKTAPGAPKVNEVSDKATSVTGKAEIGSIVTVKHNNKNIGTATADKKGNFSIKISKKKAGSVLYASAKDKAGNTGKAAKVTVKDKTAPGAPKVNEVNDKATKVTGKAEIGSTVTVKYNDKNIGTAKADKNGKFSVKISKKKAGSALYVSAKDKAGNTGKATKVTVKKSK